MPPRKEDQIQIPENVLSGANAAAMRGQAIADTGSVFTERERFEMGVPRFPFGGATSTSLDMVDRRFATSEDAPVGGFTRTNPNTSFTSTQNQANVQYERDAATRMANRYTLPTEAITSFGGAGGAFGSRISNTLYSNPERAANIENRRAEMNTYNPLPTSPNVGAAGFSRGIETGAGGRTEQIISPYGFASTNLTPQQMEQRALARQQAEQMGTMPRTPEQQQALLAQMRERGAAIGQRLATEESKRQQESIQRGYLFRQRLAETEAQRALTPAFGGSVTRGAAMRGAQAEVEAERWKQAQAGRSPMSQEPLEVRGLQFRRAGMGQFAPIRGLGNDWATNFVFGGPQPAGRSAFFQGMTGPSSEFDNFKPFEWNMNPFTFPRS